MCKALSFTLLFCSLFAFAQKDSLTLGDRYSEDQMYVMATYNTLVKQPKDFRSTSFSYSLSFGFLKDIIINKQGSFSTAIGVGYSYDSFNHAMDVSLINNSYVFSPVNNGEDTHKLHLHTLEIPFELRFRNSTANKYNFWRIYTGIKLGYNFSNSITTKMDKFSNLEFYKKWQYGLTISAGYDAFTLHAYYGLSSIFENANVNGNSIDSRIMKIGIVFYLL